MWKQHSGTPVRCVDARIFSMEALQARSKRLALDRESTSLSIQEATNRRRCHWLLSPWADPFPAHKSPNFIPNRDHVVLSCLTSLDRRYRSCGAGGGHHRGSLGCWGCRVCLPISHVSTRGPRHLLLSQRVGTTKRCDSSHVPMFVLTLPDESWLSVFTCFSPHPGS